jgi:hypothetical protein
MRRDFIEQITMSVMFPGLLREDAYAGCIGDT